MVHETSTTTTPVGTTTPSLTDTQLEPAQLEAKTGLDENAVENSPPQGFTGLKGALISACIVLCQLVQMIPYGAGVSDVTNIAKALNLTQQQAVWIIGAYPLTQGSFVLMGGRVGAVYGHKNTAVVAGIWWVIFQLVAGFMRGLVPLSVMRALSGIGGAFLTPNIIALLLIQIPPGRLRNVSVGLFGAMAPIGAAGGSIFPGFFGQLVEWWWLFFFLAILGTVVFGAFYLVVPSEGKPMDPNGKIDYIGAYFGVAGLLLFNFSWVQASAVGWEESYVYALLIVAILHFVLFTIWESRFAKEPLLPLDVWRSRSFTLMIVSCFLTFMGVGGYIWYACAWSVSIRGYTTFASAATYAPFAVCGATAAVGSAWAVSRFPAQYLLAFGSMASTISIILVVTMPAQQIYWAQMFPAMIIGGFGPDFLFTAAQIIASNTVKRKHQGAAGSLIATVLSYGLSTGLGFCGTVERYTNDGGKDLLSGYKNALYLAVGMTGVSILIALLFVRIPKEEREGWNEDEL